MHLISSTVTPPSAFVIIPSARPSSASTYSSCGTSSFRGTSARYSIPIRPWILRCIRLPSCIASFCAPFPIRLSISPERKINSTRFRTEIRILVSSRCSIAPIVSICSINDCYPPFQHFILNPLCIIDSANCYQCNTSYAFFHCKQKKGRTIIVRPCIYLCFFQ